MTGTIYNPNHMYFAQIPNYSIEDKSISSSAFRVFSYLFSKPSNWVFLYSDIELKFGISRKTLVSPS
jgi:hypothetical protein